MSISIIIMASTTMLLAAYIGVVVYRIKNNEVTTSKLLNVIFSLGLIGFKAYLQTTKGFGVMSAVGMSVGFVYAFIVPALIIVFLINKFKFNSEEFFSAWFFTQICCLFVIATH